MMRKYLLIGASAFVLGAGSMAYVGQTAAAKAPAPSRETYKMLELFGDVLDIAKKNYVTQVNEKEMIEAAINGMLFSLDPHSSYLNPESYNDLRDQTRGAYGGLGLEVVSEQGVVKVVSPIDDTPAARAGIEAGDLIIAIDNQSVAGLPLSDAVKQMRGAPGAPITLSVVREGKDPFDVKLTREVINVVVAKGKMEGDFGYLRISQFNEKATDEATRVLRELKAKNPNMKGLILDLRDNPGGLLDQSVSIADMFLDGGEVVSQRNRDERDIERYNARPGDILNGLPMVVLVNGGSASASEIVAGALQDRKRAEVIGVTTFGKGSVQSVIPLGQDGALKLTTGRYFTPSGKSIQKTGIEPDLEVARTREEAEAMARRAFQGEAFYRNALNAEAGKARREAHDPAEAPPEGFDTEKGDFQLARAVEVLKHGGVAQTPKLPGAPARLAGVSTPTDRAAPPRPANDPVTPDPDAPPRAAR